MKLDRDLSSKKINVPVLGASTHPKGIKELFTKSEDYGLWFLEGLARSTSAQIC
jgi:hypothetical protein